jgi:hypothetical protein
MSSVTMSSAYNKKGGKNCTRVGNWVEELALKDMTGDARFFFAFPRPLSLSPLHTDGSFPWLN